MANKIYNNIATHVLNTASRVLFFSGIILFASCNLFIEDELNEDDEFANLPVHTGYAYENIVHEETEYYDISYQLNTNVNIVRDEAQSYMKEAHVHATGALSSVDFSLDMPQDLRPVRGEYLLCGPSELLPHGLVQKVLIGVEMDGVYRVITCATDFENLFKNIDMTIDIGKLLDQEGISDIDEDDVRTDSSETPTRAIEFEDQQLNEGKKKFPYEFNIGLNKEEEIGNLKATGDVAIKTLPHENDDDNKIELNIAPKVKLLKVNDYVEIPFGLELTSKVTLNAYWNISGSAKLEGPLYETKNFLPKTAGTTVPIFGIPVWIQAVCGFSVGISIEINGSADVSCKIPFKTYISHDLFDFSQAKMISSVAQNVKQWKLYRDDCAFNMTAGVEAAAELSVELTPGVAIGTEYTSIRAQIGAKANAGITSLRKNIGDFNYGWGFQNNEGYTVSFDYGAGIMVDIPTTIEPIISDMVQSMADAQQTAGQIFAFLALGDADADTYNGYMEAVNELNDLLLDLKPDDPEENDDNSGESTNSYSFFVWCSENSLTSRFVPKPLEWYWLPKLDDSDEKRFQATKKLKAAGYRSEDMIHAQFGFSNCGVYSHFDSYYPCLMITDTRNQFQYIAFDKTLEVNDNLRRANNKKRWIANFDIPLSKLPPEEELLAYPGFCLKGEEDKFAVLSGKDNAYNNFYFNKPEIISTYTPSESRLLWIVCKDQPQKLPTKISGCSYVRTFYAKWELLDYDIPGKHKYTGIEYSFSPTENKYTRQRSSLLDREYVASFNRYMKDTDDLEIEVYPYAVRDDGSDKGETRRSDFSYIGKMESNTCIVFNDDGTYEVLQGVPPDFDTYF